MLFDRIYLHNFQRYTGEFKIDFPDPETKKSLTLVLAPNNAGKSTIIRALKFLLYGDLGKKTSSTAWELVNERARETSEDGENVKAWVEARIRISGEDHFTIRRSLTIRRIPNSTKWFVEGPTLYSKQSDNPGEKFVADSGIIQGKLVRAVPDDLFGWFYFHGEPADGIMIHGGSEGVRGSLNKVIQMQRWDDAWSLVKKMVDKIGKEIAAEVGVNADYGRIQSQLSAVQNGLQASKDSLAKCAVLLEEGADKLVALDAKIDLRAKAASETELLLKQFRKLEKEKSDQVSIAERAAGSYRSLVFKAGALPFLKRAFDAADLRLESLRDKNLLPADVSKGFIERLLADDSCVCGRPHDNDAIKYLNQYLSSTLASQTNSDLLTLSNRLDPSIGSPYRKRLNGHSDELRRLREAEESARRELARITKELDALQPPDKGKLDDFQSLMKERGILSAKIDNVKDKQRELTSTKVNQEQAIKRLKGELNAIAPKTKGSKVSQLNEQLQKAEALLDALQTGREQFQMSVATILRTHLSQLFDGAVTSGNRSHVDSRTFLPAVKTPAGQVEKDPGGGEKQMLELAYVIALAQLRREINETVRSAGLGGNLLGPQSFILDSPFTSADPNYMRAIADFLPGKAQQMMILVAKQNWPDTVRAALENHVTAAYAITLHTPAEIKEPDAYKFEFNGKKLDLLKRIPRGEPVFTSAKKI